MLKELLVREMRYMLWKTRGKKILRSLGELSPIVMCKAEFVQDELRYLAESVEVTNWLILTVFSKI